MQWYIHITDFVLNLPLHFIWACKLISAHQGWYLLEYKVPFICLTVGFFFGNFITIVGITHSVLFRRYEFGCLRRLILILWVIIFDFFDLWTISNLFFC